MIKVYGFGPNMGVPDPSPFVLKVLAYLKFAGIEHELVGGIGNLQKAPRGKLPFIDDNGEKVSDSSLILQYLAEQYAVDLDKGLSEEQRANAFMYSKVLDECYYWCVLYCRWQSDDNWPMMKSRFFKSLPPVVRNIAPNLVRRNTKKSLHAQGMGRLTQDEVLELSNQVLHSLSVLLGDKPYFFGREPASFDAIAYGHLAGMILSEFIGPFVDQAKSYDNLVAYCQRIQAEFFAEPE